MTKELGSAQIALPSSFGLLYVWVDEKQTGFDRFGKESVGVVTRLRIGEVSEVESRESKLVRSVKSLLTKYLSGDLEAIEHIAVAQPGTPFRQAVWTAMREISAGSTDSYAALAHRSQHPQAFRAAASACSNNAIPLIVPCHRVVTSSGAIGKYYYGHEVKAAILRHEKAI